jgi:hypothetical protein
MNLPVFAFILRFKAGLGSRMDISQLKARPPLKRKFGGKNGDRVSPPPPAEVKSLTA